MRAWASWERRIAAWRRSEGGRDRRCTGLAAQHASSSRRGRGRPTQVSSRRPAMGRAHTRGMGGRAPQLGRVDCRQLEALLDGAARTWRRRGARAACRASVPRSRLRPGRPASGAAPGRAGGGARRGQDARSRSAAIVEALYDGGAGSVLVTRADAEARAAVREVLPARASTCAGAGGLDRARRCRSRQGSPSWSRPAPPTAPSSTRPASAPSCSARRSWCTRTWRGGPPPAGSRCSPISRAPTASSSSPAWTPRSRASSAASPPAR